MIKFDNHSDYDILKKYYTSVFRFNNKSTMENYIFIPKLNSKKIIPTNFIVNYDQISLMDLSDISEHNTGIYSNPYDQPITNLTYNLWFTPVDIPEVQTSTLETILESDTDDKINNIFEITKFVEKLNLIINKDLISPEDLDTPFKIYLTSISDIIQGILDELLESPGWNFNPMERFMHIYLLLASKYEFRALKYLFKSEYFSPRLITLRDKNGYSPLFHICTNNLLDYKNIPDFLLNFIMAENLSELYGDYPLLNYILICHDSEILKIILNLPNIWPIITKPNKNGINTPLYLAAYDNIGAGLSEILNNPNMAPEYFNQLDNNGSNILSYCLIYNPDNGFKIFNLLLDSKYLTQNLFDQYHLVYGNILNLALFNKPDLVKYIINHKFFNKSILNMAKIFLYDISKTNLDLIIGSPYYSKNIFDTYLPDIAINNKPVFEYLIYNNIISSSDLLNKFDKNSNTLILISGPIINLDILYLIFNSKLNTNSQLFLLNKDSDGRNLIMRLIINSINTDLVTKIKIFLDYLLDKNYLTREILMDSDNNFYNLFYYICVYYPDIGLKILDQDNNIPEYLWQPFKNNSHIINTIFYNSNDIIGTMVITLNGFMSSYNSDIEKLLINLINSKYLNSHMLVHQDINNMNLFLEICYLSPQYLKYLFKRDLITKNIFESKNIYQDNLITILFNPHFLYSTNITENTILYILNSKYMAADILNNRNSQGETAFLLACKHKHKKFTKLARLILFSIYFDINNIINPDIKKNTCFSYACENGNKILLELICGCELFTQSMFLSCDICLIPHLITAINKDVSIAKYILTHKFCSPDLFFESYKYILSSYQFTEDFAEIIINSEFLSEKILLYGDYDKKNLICYILKYQNPGLFQQVLDNPACTARVLSHTDSNKNNFLEYLLDIKTLQLILRHPKFDPVLLTNRNNKNFNIINKWLNNGIYFPFLIDLLNSEKISLNILKTKDFESKSLITNLFLNYEMAINILKLSDNILSKSDLLERDNSGNTCLHNLSKYYYHTLTESQISEEQLKIIYNRLKYFLNHDKLSVELLEIQNHEGNTFLMMNPHLLKIILDSKYFSYKLINICNLKGSNLLNIICLNYKKYLDLLVSHPNIPEDYFLESNQKNIMNINYIILSDNSEKLINSNKYSDKIFNTMDKHGYTPLLFTIIITKNINNIKLLVNSDKINLTESFEIRDNTGRNILMTAALTTPEIFELILNSKYIKPDMFFVCDKYKHNTIIYAISNSIGIIKQIVESKYWSDELKYYKDIDNDYLLIYPYNKPEIVKYFLNNSKSDQIMVNSVNNMGYSCAHYYAKYNQDSLKILLKSNFCNQDLINIKNNNGNTCLHLACKFNFRSAELLLKSKFARPELLAIQNSKGKNIFMILLKYNKNPRLINIFKSQENNILDLINNLDTKGNNLLYYIVKYNSCLLEPIIKKINPEILSHRNNKYLTIQMVAAKYSGESLRLLLNNNQDLYTNHLDYGSVLTIGARYQPLAIKYILNWPNLDWKIINTTDKKLSFVDIACKYNPESLKYALESPVDLKLFFLVSNNCCPFLIACQYQPQAVKYIMESKYFDPEYLLYKFGDRGIIHEAFDLQPRALLYILKSKYITPEILAFEDEKGYKLIHNLKQTYPNLNSEFEISNMELTKYDNILFNKKNGDILCEICLIYKSAVIFNPCYHMACLGCAFKLRTCHMCRAIIADRKIIFH